MTILLVIFGVLLFIGLVVAHELGHFYVARKTGVEVEEFGLGFPPRAWSRKLASGLLFSINWLPLGGFVKLKGEYDASRVPGSFGSARLRSKILILLAGVTVNFVLAFVIFTITALAGMPQILENQYKVASDSRVIRRDVIIAEVTPDSPAAKAGLKTQDRLASIGIPDKGQRTVTSADTLSNLTGPNAGQEVVIEYRRKDELKRTTATLLTNEEVEASKKPGSKPKGYLGVRPTEYVLERSTWSAPIVAAGLTAQFTKENTLGLGRVISNVFKGQGKAASEQVSGPIGVARLVFDSSTLGYQALLLVIGLISLTLALMNALPIPALDGGRLFVILFFRTIRKQLTKNREELIHGTGFMILISLILLISVVDVVRLF